MSDSQKYIMLLAEKYPTQQEVCKEIINLSAILNLPKGTEHFMSDLHGEYEAFLHILNNCSGVIKEKVDRLFSERLCEKERQEICTVIYYPNEKLSIIREECKNNPEWYRMTLNHLIDIAKMLSSKYTRSKVRKALPSEFAYIIDELLHVQEDEDNNQVRYHQKILDTIIGIDNCDEFIVALSGLIKRLAVEHLHIVGDIFDRGAHADKIIDLLMAHHSLDIEWGNHDILWLGAAAGSEACIANAVRNSIKFKNIEMLESGYGISLRNLTLFAEHTYKKREPMEAALKAISVIMFKLEGEVISRNPEYEMDERRLLHLIDYENGQIEIDGKTYKMNDVDFPTVKRENPYELSDGEKEVMQELKISFLNSRKLQKQAEFLYRKGGMYKCYNSNLLYHGCVPLDKDGNLDTVTFQGKVYQGKSYLDYAEKMARAAYYEEKQQAALDFIWYLWCGKKSPLSGRNVRTFERTFINDQEAWIEESNPYYGFYYEEKICRMILREFGLYADNSHIIMDTRR